MLTNVLLALNAFLLMALFGLRVARLAEQQVCSKEPQPIQLKNWRRDTPSSWWMGHRCCRYEIELQTGERWTGYNNWWWDSETSKNAPAELVTGLRAVQKQIEDGVFEALDLQAAGTIGVD